jgi:hypothetical protein
MKGGDDLKDSGLVGKNNIKMDEMLKSVDWIQPAHDRVHGNEFSGRIKGGGLLEQLTDYQLLKRTLTEEFLC